MGVSIINFHRKIPDGFPGPDIKLEISMNRHFKLIFPVLLLILLCASPILAQDELIVLEEGAVDNGAGGPIEEYIAGYEMTEGMFSYYMDPVTHHTLIEINPDQLNHVYIISSTLNEGTGDGFFTAPMMWGRSLVEFRRDGNSIEIVEPNYQVTTVMGEPMARAVEVGTSDVILGRAYIEAEDPDDGRIVIDLPTILLSSIGIDPMSLTWNYGYGLDYDGTYIEDIQGYTLNDEIDARAIIYGAGDIFGYETYGGQEIGIHFSFAEPPPDDFVPRLSDDRIGLFLDTTANYSVETDSADTRLVRYINRWRLEKADPDAEISEPVEPITFWLENNIPLEYRAAVRDGILAWNVAFEDAGFRNAVRVRQMPDDADWDPGDIRYNCIRWFVSPNSMYAIGPSLTDPRTGEIYAADIGVSADMMAGPYREFDITVSPLSDALSVIMPPGWPNLDGHQIRWDDDTYRLIEQQVLPTGMHDRTDHFAAIHAFEAARAATVLRVRDLFEPGSELEHQYIHDYLEALIMHEVGHVLGMRHNFAGSAGTPYWKLQNSLWTREHGLSQSIMDYTVANIAPAGELQGEYFQSVPGDYDRWVIEYAYTPFNAETPEDEAEELEGIAERSPAYRYNIDYDYYGWSRNMDPDLYTWDLSDDQVRWYTDRLRTSEQLIDSIMEYWSQDGNRAADFRMAFIYAITDYYFAGAGVPRLIGGVRAYYDHVGDPDARPAMVPVSAEEQRSALRFLADELWTSDPWQFDPDLLNMLGRDPEPGINWMSALAGTRDLDLHALVNSFQSEPFYWIYDSMVLERVLNNSVRMPEGEEVFTLVELFDTVRNAIWSELDEGANIDSFRRNLQRSHLEMIKGIVLMPAMGTPDDAVALARRDLHVLKSKIETLLSGDSAVMLDTMTQAHLADCLSTIDLTLEAPMDRGGGFGIMFY